jgi:type IV secretory pathway VirB2 component (pilin)
MKNIRFILFTIAGTLVLLAVSALSVDAASNCAPGKICNPLGSTTTLNQVLTIIISTVQVIAGILSVVYIILAGLKFVMANGDTKKIETARTMLLYVVIGVAIIFGAQAISLVVQNTIMQVGSGK